MKNNAKQILVMFAAMLLLAGCKSGVNKYKNVIVDIAHNKSKKMLLLRDVKVGDERIYTIDHGMRFGSLTFHDAEYFHVGDTVVLLLDKTYYVKQKCFTDGNGVALDYNKDTIFARKMRENFQQQMQEFNKMKQENTKEAQR